MIQQQLAGIDCFNCWHLAQISTVSLQELDKRGIMQHPVVNSKQMHQAQATRPMCFFGMLAVSQAQAGQNDSPNIYLKISLFCMMLGKY